MRVSVSSGRAPRSRMRSVLTVAPLVFILAIGWASTPSVALGAGNCAQKGAYFAGWWSSPNLTGHEPEGTKANLTYQSAASCQGFGGGGGYYSGWVMIAGNNQQFKYAQAGFMFDGNPLSCKRHFSEYANATEDGHFTRKTGSCVSAGEVHTPMVKYVAATGKTQMWIDSTLFDTMAVCSCTWPRPLMVEWLGESHDKNSDVPGLVGTKTDWASGQIQYFSDDTWHGTCSTITLFKTVDARFAADAPACNHTRSWTATP